MYEIKDSPFLPNVRLIAPDRPGFRHTDFVEDAYQPE